MNANASGTDAEIVKRILSGNREDFRLLVERHQTRVFACVRRVIRDADEAEDVAQDAFVKAYAHLADYNDRWAFSTWIATIATRTALNAARQQKARAMQSLEDFPEGVEPVVAQPEVREALARNEWLEKLRAEVAGLSDKMRLIFGLRHEDDLSIEEIAQLTRSSPSSVKVTLHRARLILKERLKGFSDWA